MINDFTILLSKYIRNNTNRLYNYDKVLEKKGKVKRNSKGKKFLVFPIIIGTNVANDILEKYVTFGNKKDVNNPSDLNHIKKILGQALNNATEKEAKQYFGNIENDVTNLLMHRNRRVVQKRTDRIIASRWHDGLY